jgi:hypothetical protein
MWAPATSGHAREDGDHTNKDNKRSSGQTRTSDEDDEPEKQSKEGVRPKRRRKTGAGRGIGREDDKLDRTVVESVHITTRS